MTTTGPRGRRVTHPMLAVSMLLAAIGTLVPVTAPQVARAETPAPLTIDAAAHLDQISVVSTALPDGGAVLAGRGEGRFTRTTVVERIAADGTQVWLQDFTDLMGDRQFPLIVSADADRIIVAGTVRRRGDDGYVRILDHDGTVRSTTFFASTDHQLDSVTSIAALPDGALVVVGRTGGDLARPRSSPTRADGFIALVEPDGSVAWTQQHARRWGATGPVPTVFDHVLVAPDGRILVVAEVRCNSEAWCAGQQPELAFLVLDRAGTLADVVRVAYADLFPGAALAGLHVGEILPGPDGPIVTGYQSGSLDSLRVSGLGWDLTPAWAGPSVLGTNGGLFAGGPAGVLADGRIVVAPTSSYGAAFDGANQGGPDGLVALLSDRGQLLGVRQYGGPADERAMGLAVLTDGRVLVTGTSGRGLSTHGLVPTSSTAGTRLTVSLTDPAAAHVHIPGTPTPATTVSTDAEWGDPDAVQPEPPAPPAPTTVDGAAGLLSLVASTRVDARGGEVAELPGGAGAGTVTAGWRSGAPSTLTLARRAADGTAVWTRAFDALTQNSNGGTPQLAVADDVAGAPRIVLATSADATSAGANSGHVIAVDGDGTELWSRTIDAPTGAYVLVEDVHVAPDGTVITVGATSAGGVGLVPLVVRHEADGTLAWARDLARPAAGMFTSVHVAPDGTIVAVEVDRPACSVAEPCEPRAEVHLVRIAPEDGSVIERVTHPTADLFGMAVRFRVDGSPYAEVIGAHSGPDGPVIAGLVMNSTGETCLVVAGVGWDLERRFAGPATHCADGADLEGWGALTVLADGRVVTAASSYYDVDVAGPSLGHVDVVLGVHDAAGVLLDAVQYGGTFQDVPGGVVGTADGDVIVATSAGAGVTSLGAAPSVTTVGEHTRLTLVGGVSSWRDQVALRIGGGQQAATPDTSSSSASSSAPATSAPAASASASESSSEPGASDTSEAADSDAADVDGDRDAADDGDGDAADVDGDGDAADVDGGERRARPSTVPSAPQDVRVTAEYGRIHVAWSAPVDTGVGRVLDYRIEVTDATTGALVASRTGLLLRSVAVLTPIGGGDVRIRIAAIGEDGIGAWSTP